MAALHNIDASVRVCPHISLRIGARLDKAHHHDAGLCIDNLRRQSRLKGSLAGDDFRLAENMMEGIILADPGHIFARAVLNRKTGVAHAPLERNHFDGPRPAWQSPNPVFCCHLAISLP